MAVKQDLKIRTIHGRKYRFAPDFAEMLELERQPFVDTISSVLAGQPQEVIDQAVAFCKDKHEAAEDERIAAVRARHDRIRKDGVEVGRTVGARWQTTRRG